MTRRNSTFSKTLYSFKKIIDDYDVTDIKAVATAAIRQATNKEEIIDKNEKRNRY